MIKILEILLTKVQFIEQNEAKLDKNSQKLPKIAKNCQK